MRGTKTIGFEKFLRTNTDSTSDKVHGEMLKIAGTREELGLLDHASLNRNAKPSYKGKDSRKSEVREERIRTTANAVRCSRGLKQNAVAGKIMFLVRCKRGRPLCALLFGWTDKLCGLFHHRHGETKRVANTWKQDHTPTQTSQLASAKRP